MIELERHIEILLLDNDCVIVPGLGGFMTNHVEARYDVEDQLFLPPLRTLGFNPKLKVNDSLLAQSYIEAYDISYPEAMHRIEDEVNELRQHLKNKGHYELNDIGVLSMNEDNNCEFRPCEAGILTPSLYALDSFEIEPIAHVPERKKETAEGITAMAAEHATNGAAEAKVSSEKQEAESNARIVALESASEEDGARMVSIRVSVLRNIVAAAIAIMAFMLFSTPLGNDKQTTAALDSGMLKRVMPKDMVSGEATVKLVTALREETQQQTAAQQESEAKAETTKQTAQKEFFTLVLASHVTKKNAADYVEQLAKSGFNGACVIQRTSTKVIYGSYKTESAAYEALGKLRSEEPFREAWVLHIK